MSVPVEPCSPKRVDRSFARVEQCSRIEEIEVEHYQKGIGEGIQDLPWFTAGPACWKSKDADQMVHAALKPFYFSRRIQRLLVHSNALPG
jgi:hypothetical protein